MKTSTLTASILLASAPFAGLAIAGHAAAATPTQHAGRLGSSHYSITQDVDNTTNEPMTLTSINADNGGTVEPGYATTIAPNTTQPYKAANTGNGVQLTMTFTTPSGAVIHVDSDVPKTDSNWTQNTVTATDMQVGNYTIGYGDNPTASFSVVPATMNGNQTTGGTKIYDYDPNGLPPIRAIHVTGSTTRV